MGFFLVVWSDSFAPLNGATLQYNSRIWQTDDGLPQNTVQTLCQARDGYLWLGTREGAVRFDGVRFSVFDLRNTPEMKGQWITAYCQTRDGSLWIATEDNGLIRLKDGKFSNYGQAEGLADIRLRCLYESRDGSFWIGSLGGLFRYQDNKFVRFTRANGLASDLLREVREDRAGNLWVAAGNDVTCFRNGVIAPEQIISSYADVLPGLNVRAICEDRSGGLWIGSNGGLTEVRNGQVRHITKTNGLPHNVVSAIYEDRLGNLWIGTYGGLCRMTDGAIITEVNQEGEAFDAINAIIEDHEGNVWVGAKDGLHRLTPKRFVTHTKQHGLTHNNVMSVIEDRAGVVWIATWGGGLNSLKEGKIAPFHSANFTSDLILSLCESRSGGLWMGMEYSDGIYFLKDGELTHYSYAEGLTDPAASVLYEDRQGALWIGNRTALNRFKDGQFTRYTRENGLAGDMVRVIHEDREGTLWVGTTDGLSRMKDGKFVSFTTVDGLSHNYISAIHEDGDQTFWIGTRGGGLCRMSNAQDSKVETRNSKVHSYTSKDGLFSDDIYEILEDDLGSLWMSGLKGVFRVEKRILEDFAAGKISRINYISYGKADGMGGPQCNGVAKPAAWKSKDGRLWFATTKGVAVCDPKAEVNINEVAPSVLVEQVRADNMVVPLHDGVRLPAGRGELEFQFTALSFRVPENVRFKYMLEGVDKNWVEAGTRREARYNNIYPGSYRFRVIACNNDGIWNETGATVSFVLSPHYWQTWWFAALSFFGAVGFVAGTARYMTRKKLQRRLERLEQQHAIEKERARIAKDIHDDLGSSLTRITLLGELTEADKGHPAEVEAHARKIVTSARETVRSLDEIVWAVNPRNDTLNSLVEYITHYANEFFENTRVSCRLEIPVDLPELLLPSEVRHSVFLVVKESLNNVLKHAEASKVTVRLAEGGGRVEIQIVDNGRGFITDEPPAGRRGNGLGNMRKRIESLGGQFCLESVPGQGTRLKFSIKVR